MFIQQQKTENSGLGLICDQLPGKSAKHNKHLHSYTIKIYNLHLDHTFQLIILLYNIKTIFN